MGLGVLECALLLQKLSGVRGTGVCVVVAEIEWG